MVVKMMRWRPWPPLFSKKFEVRLIAKRLEGGCDLVGEGVVKENVFAVEIRWKGSKIALSPFRRTVKRNFTREEGVGEGSNGVVEWDQEFQCVCNLSGYKENAFLPWEIVFTVLNGLNVVPKNKALVIGTASLNLAEYASASEAREFELNIPLIVSGSANDFQPSLSILLSLLELQTAAEPNKSRQRSIVPVPSPPRFVETPTPEKDEVSALKAGLRRVKIFTEYVSSQRALKPCCEESSEGMCSTKSEEGYFTHPFDSDSLEEYEERESDENKEDSNIRKSFSYGTLSYANYAGGSFYSNKRISGEDEDRIYYSKHRSDIDYSHSEDSSATISESHLSQNLKRTILPWRKRKLSFRSPRTKGEPLLKKDYAEGGDDIDFYRRQLSSDESLSLRRNKTDEESGAKQSSVSEFGDDDFVVGIWEQKDITSRDGHMKLQTQVFFASIDQRSEKAAGESACTVLVAVIADWLRNNYDLIPIKSQFDNLIREGSLEWRNLCENEAYKERFPDRHFDLETVLQAKMCSLSVISGKSFVGFFHPDGMEEGGFDFLHGAMSFDNIWDEISCAGSEYSSNDEPQVYIVSWNDHFFVLKVEREAYYIIDTLGERLYEGCNQAYILKFDRNTTISKLPIMSQSSEENPVPYDQFGPGAAEITNQQAQQSNPKELSMEGKAITGLEEPTSKVDEDDACRGKESCKEYIKSFLAAIPIRELQEDIKKGLISSTPLHQRLQIEFHYTQLHQEATKLPVTQSLEPCHRTSKFY